MRRSSDTRPYTVNQLTLRVLESPSRPVRLGLVLSNEFVDGFAAELAQLFEAAGVIVG